MEMQNRREQKRICARIKNGVTSIGFACVLVGCGGHGATARYLGATWFQVATQTAAIEVQGDYSGPKIGALGAIVGVSTPQGTWYQAFGSADASGTPMRSNMQFRIASISKLFTALSALRLMDMGKLNATDKISTYVPNPNPSSFAFWQDIELQDLADHKSGLSGPSMVNSSHHYQPGDTFALSTDAVDAPAPSHYANINFTALGLAVQSASNQTLSSFIQQQFLGRLHLSNTTDATSGNSPKLSCHGFQDGQDVTNDDPSWAWGAGTMVSTAQDLVTWIRAVGGAQLLSPANQDLLLAEVQPSSDTGFGIQEYGEWIGHLGDFGGFASACFYNPKLDAAVVVMVNRLDTADETSNFRRQYPILHDVIDTFFPNDRITLVSANAPNP